LTYIIQRIEPFGWDSEDRTYIVLDDNRLYRQTAPPPPPPPPAAPKKNSKKAKAALRASKRRKVSEPEVSDEEVIDELVIQQKEEVPEEDDGLGGMKWECLAINLDDLNRFIASIEKSRDPNEKILRARITEQLLPLLEKQEEARKRKAAQKERELLNLEKLATAKRSSRIAGKLELQRQEEEAREAERKRQAELAMAKKEQEKWMKLEKERESRMMTREQRLKEREARRILHEEELAGLSEDSKKLEAGESRLSERHLKAEIEKKKQALEELAEEDDWVFDCICGAYGQVDDGSHSISCEKCNIWQHTKCVGISEAAANRDDFHFICKTCQRRAEKEEKAKHRPTIKLKFNRPGSSSSPVPSPQFNGLPANTSPYTINGAQSPGFPSQKANSAFHVSPPRPEYESPYSNSWKLSFKPHSPNSNGVNHTPSLPKVEGKQLSHGLPDSAQWSPSMNGLTRPNIQASPYTNGGHAFSPPHPYSPTSLPPPSQNRDHSFMNAQPSTGVSGTYVSPLQNNTYPHIQSYQRPTPTPHATQDAQYRGHSLLQAQTGLNGRPNSEAHPPPLVQTREPQRWQPTSDAERSQQRASGALSTPGTAVAAPPQMPPTGEHGSAFSSSSRVFSTTAQLPLESPPAKPTSLTSPSNKGPEKMVISSEISHASALPPGAPGISPTKHSPPQPTTSNGRATFSIATPSILPPVAPLPPSPQLPNRTPPVKSAVPGQNRLPRSPSQPATSNSTAIANSTTTSVLPTILPPVRPLSSSQQSNLAPLKLAEPEQVMPSVVSPQPTIAEGNVISNLAIPSVLPPVVNLSPSPQQPNLVAPVKSAEQENGRLTSGPTAP
jgi:hypothetical protein